MNINLDSLKDLLLNIADHWERHPEDHVQTVAQMMRQELEKAEINTNDSGDFPFPDLSRAATDSEMETRDIFENVLYDDGSNPGEVTDLSVLGKLTRHCPGGSLSSTWAETPRA